MELVGRRYDTGEPVSVTVSQGRIAQITSLASTDERCHTTCWIAPGLIDIQVNGYGGQEFSSPDLTEHAFEQVVRTCHHFGVTRLCPTITTQAMPVLEHALRVIDRVCRAVPFVARSVAGVHLEGPFLSREDGPRGAHPLDHCREPSWDDFQRLQEAAGGRIRLLTMAVEFDSAPQFIRRAVESGVVVAIGHTAATVEQIHRAVDAGARLSTHLGNGCHERLHRHQNYLWAQLADDRLMASLVADGHHLPPWVIKTFVRAKGPDRCILVSDLSGQAGRPPGRYSSPFCDVEVLEDGRLVVAGQHEFLAGASLPLGVGLVNVQRFAGVDLASAVRMATANPARLLGLPAAELAEGAEANLVVFEMVGADQVGGSPGLVPQVAVLGPWVTECRPPERL